VVVIEWPAYSRIYTVFYISQEPAARSFLGRIVSGEVFAGAQQKLSAQKREPKKKNRWKWMEGQTFQDDGENIVKVSSMRRYNNSRVNNNNNSYKATMSVV